MARPKTKKQGYFFLKIKNLSQVWDLPASRTKLGRGERKKSPSCLPVTASKWLCGEFYHPWATSNWKGLKFILARGEWRGLPWWLSGKESACQCREHGFNLWSRKIPHATEQLSLWPQLLSLSSKAWETQLLKSVCLQPVLCSKRSHFSEKPVQHSWRVAPTGYSMQQQRSGRAENSNK